jgi:hypothetical protein
MKRISLLAACLALAALSLGSAASLAGVHDRGENRDRKWQRNGEAEGLPKYHLGFGLIATCDDRVRRGSLASRRSRRRSDAEAHGPVSRGRISRHSYLPTSAGHSRLRRENRRTPPGCRTALRPVPLAHARRRGGGAGPAFQDRRFRRPDRQARRSSDDRVQQFRRTRLRELRSPRQRLRPKAILGSARCALG